VGPAARAGPPEGAASGSAVLRALAEEAQRAEREIDGALKVAASGRTFSPAQLLVLEARVFRYSQAVEVLSRGADRMVGAVRQTMGTQV
jgi:hypothetical protein